MNYRMRQLYAHVLGAGEPVTATKHGKALYIGLQWVWAHVEISECFDGMFEVSLVVKGGPWQTSTESAKRLNVEVARACSAEHGPKIMAQLQRIAQLVEEFETQEAE